jgi:glycosyltransferase involved in cell wall biosynthesis
MELEWVKTLFSAISDAVKWLGDGLTWLYDNTIGKSTINKFDKIIAITKWEYPYLKKLGLKENKISYIPNGIPEQFFSQKAKKPGKIKGKWCSLINN